MDLDVTFSPHPAESDLQFTEVIEGLAQASVFFLGQVDFLPPIYETTLTVPELQDQFMSLLRASKQIR